MQINPLYPSASKSDAQRSRIGCAPRSVSVSLISNCKFSLLPFAVLTLLSAMVHADELDTLQFSVGESLVRDSNVFRLSDSIN